ncbi:hypothetical protein ERJ75_000164000 [Trypanosoma vivax]|uniref:Uncharacterized protein n=1 Tax=Trypanosoma vivax (strain Y486) TaxID=1055687 RepID=F9WVT1_TRYVY|nr:hypothetical protein ERJ75_000164000 [Trypanosoma vivax]CCD21691.1 hypothetical protein, conserved in T.vivax [Trypanosoma vivax Y486]|eukprot:CCD21691.1 hypothetical protein, conserved in T.vivax [Trypanosoma vivax Y486]
MKFFTALCVVLCSAAITVHAGSPLKYTKEMHEMCQFYSSLYSLREEENVRKILGGKHKCDDCCVDQIAVTVRSLVYAFINSQKRWSVCGEDHYQGGCCLGVEKTGTACSKGVKDCWTDCLAFTTPTYYDTSRFISSFFSKDGKLSKWLNGVETTLERNGDSCPHTGDDYGWYSYNEDIGGLFSIEPKGYRREHVTITLIETDYALDPLHKLSCMFARAGYGQMMWDGEECSKICENAVKIRSESDNRPFEVNDGVREADQTQKHNTQQVPHKAETPNPEGEITEATVDGEHVTSDSVAVTDSLEDQKQLAHAPNNTGGSFPTAVGGLVQNRMGKKVGGNVTYFVTGGVRQTGESVLYVVLLHFVKTACGTLLQ